MNSLDDMKEFKDQTLAYWKERYKNECEINTGKRNDITITLDTLEFFLWMIESKK